MASLSVRKLDEKTLHALQARALQHGLSMEEEVRQILKRAALAPDNLGQLAQNFFGGTHGVDVPTIKHKPHNPLDFDA